MTYSKYDELNDAEWLQERIDSGMSVPEIAEEVGCDRKAAANHIIRHDCEHDYRLQETADGQYLGDPEWMRRKIEDEGWSTKDIADYVDTSRPTVETWRVRYGVDASEPVSDDDSTVPDFGVSESSADDNEWPEWAKTGQAWRDKNQLYRAYWVYYWSINDIASLFDGVSKSMVRQEFYKHDIPIRDTATANKLSGMRQRGCSLEQIRREMGDSSSSPTTPTKQSPWEQYFEAEATD